MSQETKKAITGVTINYDDGTSDKLESCALAGSNDSTWFKVMFSPAGSSDKIKLNNLLVELSNSLLAAIDQDK